VQVPDSYLSALVVVMLVVTFARLRMSPATTNSLVSLDLYLRLQGARDRAGAILTRPPSVIGSI
jgi:hypothetical protein